MICQGKEKQRLFKLFQKFVQKQRKSEVLLDCKINKLLGQKLFLCCFTSLKIKLKRLEKV